jgi:adenylate kinase
LPVVLIAGAEFCDDLRAMTARPRRVVMLGAPGSGKSTHAARLAERLGAAHLNLGSLFREAAREDSPLGHEIAELMAGGKLVPDAIAYRVISERIKALPADREFVLEGYPRNAAQADALKRLLGELSRLEPRPIVVLLDTSRDELLRRLRKRRDIEGRSDDTDAAIAQRLEIYDATTTPVIAMLAEWADLVTIDGDRSIDAIAEQIARELDS